MKNRRKSLPWKFKFSRVDGKQIFFGMAITASLLFCFNQDLGSSVALFISRFKFVYRTTPARYFLGCPRAMSAIVVFHECSRKNFEGKPRPKYVLDPSFNARSPIGPRIRG